MSDSKPRERAERIASAAPRALFESALIMLSVLMGFAVNEYREYRKSSADASAVVAGFRSEISQNLRTLEDAYQRHQYFTEHLARFSSDTAPNVSAIRAIASSFPEGGLRLPTLSDAAWQTATATGALRLLDYGTAAQLSATYLIQRDLVMSTSKLIQERLFEPSTFQQENARPTLQMFSALMQQLTSQEKLLMDSCRVVLTKLPPARN